MHYRCCLLVISTTLLGDGVARQKFHCRDLGLSVIMMTVINMTACEIRQLYQLTVSMFELWMHEKLG